MEAIPLCILLNKLHIFNLFYFIFIEDIPLCLIIYKVNILFVNSLSIKHQKMH